MENKGLGVQGKPASQVNKELREATADKYYQLSHGNKKKVADLSGLSKVGVKQNIDGGFKKINRKVVRVVAQVFEEQQKEDQELIQD